MSDYVPEGMDIDPEEIPQRIGLVRWLGIRVLDQEASDVVVAEMEVHDGMRNLQQIPHGGAIATLIDTAAGLGAIRLVAARSSTVDLHVRYLAPARGAVVRAEARVVRAGRRLVIMDVRVTDDLGTLVAVATTSMAPFPSKA